MKILKSDKILSDLFLQLYVGSELICVNYD